MSTIPETTSAVFDVVRENVAALAESLKVPAEQILQVGVAGMQAEAAFSLIMLWITGVIIFVLFALMAMIVYERESEGAVLVTLPLIFMIVVFSLSLKSYIVKSNAPEYALIEKIIDIN